MPTQAHAAAAELIEEIQTRCHDGHRHAFRQLRKLAGTLAAEGPEQELSAALQPLRQGLQAVAAKLALHIDAEEQRLFPLFLAAM
jgi:iron-sulfur cluster repair protein YtfE (RIC family)